MKRLVLGMAAACLLGACATRPALLETPVAAPPTPAVAPDWWRVFGNAELDALMDRAMLQAHDIAAAEARIRQARASARIAGAALSPSVDAALSAGRQARLGGHADVDGNLWSASLGASYEVDFWGRNRAGRDAAALDLQASVFDRDTVRLSLQAGVAGGWLQAVALRQRTAIAAQNEQSAQRLLALVEARARAGASTALQLAQQRGLLATTRQQHASLRQQSAQAETTLSMLLAEPQQLRVTTRSLDGLASPERPAGSVSPLLTRRPDLARAEAALAAADARVAVARAAMLPRLTLTASLGGIADRPGRVFDNPLYSLAAGLAAPVFDAGRLAAGRELAQGRQEELLADYRQAIVAAFGDVDNALAAIDGSQSQLLAQDEVRGQASRALALAESRYRAGSDTLLTLLDAQRTLYAAQDLAVQLQARHLVAQVALVRALGGGWNPESMETTP